MTKSKAFKYPDSLDLDDQLAYGIGALVCHWGTLETLFYGLLECLAGRVGTDNGRVIWLSLRTIDARLKMISQLSKAQPLDPAIAAGIETACSRFRGVSRTRNYFCHAAYRADLDGKVQMIENVTLAHSGEQFDEDYKPLNKATLNEIANAINESARLNVDMWTLLIRLREALPLGQHLELPPQLDEYLARSGRQPHQTTDA